MKTIYEKFTDQEHNKLLRAKNKTGKTWHDFIMTLAEEPKKEIENK